MINVYDISVFGYSHPISNSLISTFGYLNFIPATSILKIDYSGQARSRLIEQFKNKPNLQLLLDSFIESFQELEYVYGDLYTERWLDEAVGAQLDGLGDIVGPDREGRDDDIYRELIRIFTSVNMSSGEWEILLTIVKEITYGTEVRIRGMFPARLTLFSNGPIVPLDIISFLEESALAGVKVEFTSAYGSEPIFAFMAEGGQAQRSNRAGFSEPTMSDSGGSLTEKFN
jgi:hypothetical protein